MPTSSSDSEGTSQRTPRRRSTTRSTTNPPATRTRKKATDDVAETLPSSVDDDFGSGVSEEKAAREVKPARRTRATSVAAENLDDVVEAPKRERRPRREPRAKPVPLAESDEKTPNLLDRSSRSDRTSNRLERQIADVESQTGMRYFSTDELDFGDDDVSAPPPSQPRGRSRISSADDRPQDARSSRNIRDTRDTRDDFERDINSDVRPMDDGDFLGEPGDDSRQSEGGIDGDGGDRRPRRRRRRRRRGPDNLGSSDTGDNRGSDPNRGAESRNFDANRGGDQNRASDGNRGDFQNRTDGRSDGRDRSRDSGRSDVGRSDVGRSQGSNRADNSRGRRPGNSGGNSGGGNNSNRGRRNEGNQPRGGSSGRDSSRGGGGRDRGGMPRRNSRQVQTTFEVIEGTFEGVLELHSRGYGFLRDPKKNYVAEDSNPFVSSSLVEKYKLRDRKSVV